MWIAKIKPRKNVFLSLIHPFSSKPINKLLHEEVAYGITLPYHRFPIIIWFCSLCPTSSPIFHDRLYHNFGSRSVNKNETESTLNSENPEFATRSRISMWSLPPAIMIKAQIIVNLPTYPPPSAVFSHVTTPRWISLY